MRTVKQINEMELRIQKETLTFMVNWFSTVMPKPFNGKEQSFQQVMLETRYTYERMKLDIYLMQKLTPK